MFKKWFTRTEWFVAMLKINQVMDTHSHKFHSEQYRKYALATWSKIDPEQLIYLVNEVWELE